MLIGQKFGDTFKWTLKSEQTSIIGNAIVLDTRAHWGQHFQELEPAQLERFFRHCDVALIATASKTSRRQINSRTVAVSRNSTPRPCETLLSWIGLLFRVMERKILPILMTFDEKLSCFSFVVMFRKFWKRMKAVYDWIFEKFSFQWIIGISCSKNIAKCGINTPMNEI